MENQEEKVYVAIGDDLQEGLETLKWVLEKWNSSSISIVILCLLPNPTLKYVYTPFGKLPASYVSDEKIEVIRMLEQENFDKNLAHYINFCGKERAEILRIEKFDEQPICKIISELISDLRMTKLVIGMTFLKSSSWYMKSKNVINELFHIQENKPEFCEMFIIERGKLLFVKDEHNKAFIEDDNGGILANFNTKKSLKNRLGKLFYENSNEKSPRLLQSSSTSNTSPNQWAKNAEEIEIYFRLMLSSNLEEEVQHDRPTDIDLTQNLSGKEKNAALKSKIREAREIVKLSKKEAKCNVEKRGKAERMISLCTQRVQELEACIARDIAIRLSTAKELDVAKEEILDIEGEIEEKKKKLTPIIELQNELSIILKSSSLAKTRVEALLGKAIGARADMVNEIEKLRRQRDVVNRQIEFCREKDAIGSVKRSTENGFRYREFNAEEIRAATDDFSERFRLKSSGGDWSNVYRGRINHTCVAVKLCSSNPNALSPEEFVAKVKLLGQIRHPNIVAVLGFCTELKCVVFEYMHNGILTDTLISPGKNKERIPHLNFHTRIRIAADISACLSFLHMSAHSGLNPSKILVDRNNIAKIHGFRAGSTRVEEDLKALGNLVLQLLPLDRTARDWPVELAAQLNVIVRKCLCIDGGDENHEMSVASLNREIVQVRKKADKLAASGGIMAVVGGGDVEELSGVPSVFLCPIFQDVMKDPHVAEDGFSYELEAIKEWLGTGHDTSPMTNLKLKHMNLIANHTLRSLIEDWHSKRSIPIG